MAIFASDTESGVAGTLLENHPLGVGGSWVKGGGRAGSMALTPTNTSRLSAGEGAYFATGTPGGADYDIEEDFVFATAQNYRALVLRGNISGALGYMVGIDNGGTWVIYKDTGPQVSVAATGITAGSTHHVKGSIRGNAITMFVDGTQILTWTDTSSTYTAAGQVGIYGYGVGTDTTGLQGKNFVATDLTSTGATTTFTLAQIKAVDAVYALTKTASGRTAPFGNSDGIEILVTGTRAVLDVQNPTTLIVSVDGGAYVPGVDDGTAKLLCFTGLTDTPHTLKIKFSEGYPGQCGIAATGTLVVTGAAPVLAAVPGYGPWHTIGSYQYTDPSVLTASGFDASDSWLKNSAVSTFAYQVNDKFSQPTIKFRAKAASVWLWCQSDTVPRCTIDGHQLKAIPYVAGVAVNGIVPSGWVQVADLDEPTGNAAATGITATCEHEFSITLGNYVTTQNGSPIYRVMIGGTGASFTSAPPANSDYMIGAGDSITQGQSYGGANYDATAGSFAYWVAAKLGIMPYLNGRAGTRIADLQSRFATDVAGVGTSLGRPPKFGLINMGTNDTNNPGDAAFIAAYQDVISKWVAAYPTTPLFCMGLKRAVDGTNPAAPASQNIATAVSNYQSANPTPGALVHFIDMSGPTNIDGELHPSNIGARIMGAYTANAVNAILAPSGGGAAYPAASVVLSTAMTGSAGNTPGTVVLPTVATVLTGTNFGPSSALTGTVALPAVATVTSGTAFGPGGSLTGTYAAGGGTGLTAEQITMAVWSGLFSDPAFNTPGSAGAYLKARADDPLTYGTAASGTMNTIVFRSAEPLGGANLANWRIFTIGRTGAGQWGTIASSSGLTQTMTLPWTTAPDATTQYQIYPPALMTPENVATLLGSCYPVASGNVTALVPSTTRSFGLVGPGLTAQAGGYRGATIRSVSNTANPLCHRRVSTHTINTTTSPGTAIHVFTFDPGDPLYPSDAWPVAPSVANGGDSFIIS